MTAQEYDPQALGTGNIKTLLSWRSPARPWKPRGRSFYVGAFVITALVSALLFLFSEYVLIFTAWALTFAAVVLASIRPTDVTHRISNQGITIGERTFLWQEMYDFYFKRQFGEEVLHVRTQTLFPGELIITLGSLSKNHVMDTIVHYLPFRESVERSFIEKAGDWLAHTFPLEKT